MQKPRTRTRVTPQLTHFLANTIAFVAHVTKDAVQFRVLPIRYCTCRRAVSTAGEYLQQLSSTSDVYRSHEYVSTTHYWKRESLKCSQTITLTEALNSVEGKQAYLGAINCAPFGKVKDQHKTSVFEITFTTRQVRYIFAQFSKTERDNERVIPACRKSETEKRHSRRQLLFLLGPVVERKDKKKN